MEPKTVLFARFPFPYGDAADVTDWLVETCIKAKLDNRIKGIMHWRIGDTPITMGRNRVVEVAKQSKADFLVMIDNDMKPDAYLKSNPNRIEVDPLTKPFWDSSFDFIWDHYERGPCMIGSPYCGPPPHENVYCFRWAGLQSDHPNPDFHITQYTREEAATRAGIEEVAALATGLVIIDMRCFDNPLVKPPYFYYEWKDQFEQTKASTEDCTFTRDLNLAGIPLYNNWDAWSGHWKRKCISKPKLLYKEQIQKKYVEAVLANRSIHEKTTFIHAPPAENMMASSMASSMAPMPHDHEENHVANEAPTVRKIGILNGPK